MTSLVGYVVLLNTKLGIGQVLFTQTQYFFAHRYTMTRHIEKILQFCCQGNTIVPSLFARYLKNSCIRDTELNDMLSEVCLQNLYMPRV